MREGLPFFQTALAPGIARSGGRGAHLEDGDPGNGDGSLLRRVWATLILTGWLLGVERRWASEKQIFSAPRICDPNPLRVSMSQMRYNIVSAL